MKLLHKSVLAILLLISSVYSETGTKSSEYFETIKKAYVNSLESENPGVRNSAIFNVVKLLQHYPDKEFSIILKKLKKISRSDFQLSIRMHANLALTIFENRELIKLVNPQSFEDATLYFNELYLKLSNPRIVTMN